MKVLYAYLRNYTGLVALALGWRPSTKSSPCSIR